MIKARYIDKKLKNSIKDTPVILINGARQTGKSTLAKSLIEKGYPAAYFTLDNAATLAAASSDPTHFIGGLDSSVIIDEIQRAPQLFLAIKESVDLDRKPGRFLLTGSANVLLLPTLSDSLAGRMEIITLWPLSQDEIIGKPAYFIDALFSKELRLSATSKLTRDSLIEKVLLGGYPEVLARKTEDRQYAWYENYITTILQRDVRDIANIEGLTQLPRLLSILAIRTGGLLNLAEISRVSGIASTTLNRYITLLQTIFLVHTIPAWSNNLSKRILKSPKIFLIDTGLNAHLSGVTKSRLTQEPGLIGPLLENFVLNELKKQLGWNKSHAEIFHFRTTTGQEVDFILENKEGKCIGIEVKSSVTVSQNDFKGLQYLSDELGEKFLRGILFYTGKQMLQFGKNLFAVPIGLIWNE